MLGKYKKKIRNYLGVSPNEVWKEYGKEATKKMEEGTVKDKLVLLVGASGTGKTTIAKELEKRRYNIIHSYTTREPREDNEWGHTFISDWYPVITTGDAKDFIGVESGGEERIYLHKMIAYKELYGDHYFATHEQYQGKGTSIYIVDPEGAEMVKENVKDAEITTILLIADGMDKSIRMEMQGRAVEDITKRLLKDEKIFKVCKCDYAIDANRESEEVLEDVLEVIGG